MCLASYEGEEVVSSVNRPLRAVVLMTSLTIVAVIAAAVFAPDHFDRLVTTILTIAVPTTAGLMAYLTSQKNSEKLETIDEKSDRAVKKAEVAAEKATITQDIVAEHIPHIAQVVEEMKSNGQGTPPHGSERP